MLGNVVNNQLTTPINPLKLQINSMDATDNQGQPVSAGVYLA